MEKMEKAMRSVNRLVRAYRREPVGSSRREDKEDYLLDDQKLLRCAPRRKSHGIWPNREY